MPLNRMVLIVSEMCRGIQFANTARIKLKTE